MNTDIHIAAVRRFRALVGDLKEMTEAERLQAESDRLAHAQYTSEHTCRWDMAALLLRFMHEVCHIPLWQARECTVVLIEQSEAFRISGRDPAEITARIVQATANVLAADATIQMYIAAAEGTEFEPFWKEVLKVLWYAQPFEHDDGGENPTLH
ncbi:hypothetical protein LB533_25730 [Mesorhizobium sp. BR1-1-13]|uniref:hypothetical protein n=1 Tax=Mesorhizobium sp. BR1-1-13 TaxID=2876656 RepID=UPI001CD06408|nr:hypothetical protein [Mesorhizobium sp. BR1-1-13]MBZ9944499.1 hypothetical protein [Mesorhizobium sp. BR1-1-13]